LEVELKEIAEIISGQSPEGENYNENAKGLPFYQGKTEFGDIFLGSPRVWTTKITKESIEGDILMSVRAPVGPVNLNDFEKICIGRGLCAIRINQNNILNNYLFFYLQCIEGKLKGGNGAIFDSINKEQISCIKIPLPPLETQRQIVEKLDKQMQALEGVRLLKSEAEKRIDEILAGVWGE